jgi:hypothetical protein
MSNHWRTPTHRPSMTLFLAGCLIGLALTLAALHVVAPDVLGGFAR